MGMYVPPANRQDDLLELHAFVRAFPFATLITVAAGEPIASHVPLQLIAREGSTLLRGHVARANAHWEHHREADAAALAVFQAPDAYVSPRWYPSKAEGGRVVPTWNYRVVHARGMLRFFDEPERLRELVASLSDAHEAAFDEPWSVDDAPPDYLEKQLRGIVGFELTVTSLLGKWKLSQNRTEADRRGTIAGLRSRGEAGARDVAAEMEKTLSD